MDGAQYTLHHVQASSAVLQRSMATAAQTPQIHYSLGFYFISGPCTARDVLFTVSNIFTTLHAVLQLYIRDSQNMKWGYR